MSLVLFLRQLFEHGRVTVPPQEPTGHHQTAELQSRLAEYAAIYRRALPAGLPELNLTAAEYAARTLYHACQLLVYRDADAEQIGRLIPVPEPVADPAEHWSVDLVLHFLPDVVRLARAAAPQDPLVLRLLELGRRWPLSSVGIPRLGTVDVAPLANHPALWTLYLDRILVARDAERLDDPRVRAGLDTQLGAYPELAGPLGPVLAAAGAVESSRHALPPPP